MSASDAAFGRRTSQYNAAIDYLVGTRDAG